jgi:CheY-like chemotaxis protein
MLEKLGFQSDVVENGQEALRALARGSYAIVLMDCQMPIVDGFEATRLIRQREASNVKREAQDRIREHETSDEIRKMPHASHFTNDAPPRHIPIIAVTANAMRGDRERCLAAGMDDYLTKPLRKEDLKGAIDRWLPASIQSHASPVLGTEENTEGQNSGSLPVIFDAVAMVRNIGGDRELMEELADLFLQRYQAMLEGIRAALADGDRQAVEQVNWKRWGDSARWLKDRSSTFRLKKRCYALFRFWKSDAGRRPPPGNAQRNGGGEARNVRREAPDEAEERREALGVKR